MTDESGMEKRKAIYRLDSDTAPAVKMAIELYICQAEVESILLMF